jgi:hypothetical protein
VSYSQLFQTLHDETREGTGLPPGGHSAISATERVKYAI